MRFFGMLSLAIALFLFSAFAWTEVHEKARTTELDVALQEFQKNTSNPQSILQLAVVQLDSNNPDALQTFEGLSSNEEWAHCATWGKAELLRRKHKQDEALALLQPILDKHPDYSPAYVTAAYAHYTMARFREAIPFAEHVIQQNSRDAVDTLSLTRAHLILTACYSMLTEDPKTNALKIMRYGVRSKRHLSKAVALLPDYSYTLYTEGSFALLSPPFLGYNLEKAEAKLLASIHADPFLVGAYVRMAQVEQVKGNQDAAAEWIEKARAIDPREELIKDYEDGTCVFLCPKVS